MSSKLSSPPSRQFAMIGLMLTALLMTACTSNTPNQNQPDDPRGGDAVSAEEIVRIETRTVGNGSYCDFPMYALDLPDGELDRKSTRLNSSHVAISYAVFCLKKKRPDAPDS